jgi:hypothetical protein
MCLNPIIIVIEHSKIGLRTLLWASLFLKYRKYPGDREKSHHDDIEKRCWSCATKLAFQVCLFLQEPPYLGILLNHKNSGEGIKAAV